MTGTAGTAGLLSLRRPCGQRAQHAQRACLTKYCEKLPAHIAQCRAGSSLTNAALASALRAALPCRQGGHAAA